MWVSMPRVKRAGDAAESLAESGEGEDEEWNGRKPAAAASRGEGDV